MNEGTDTFSKRVALHFFSLTNIEHWKGNLLCFFSFFFFFLIKSNIYNASEKQFCQTSKFTIIWNLCSCRLVFCTVFKDFHDFHTLWAISHTSLPTLLSHSNCFAELVIKMDFWKVHVCSWTYFDFLSCMPYAQKYWENDTEKLVKLTQIHGPC